ncbi:carbohydrate ABC transporter membrane protein 2 (CUT1 family) [Salana multivorans]|uniref:Carbohydrate ABC transporter membrane protein 2 (CUT1 family) n=1 Tax=Salana multivorans TaxID=120377 RepID=A0A3N2DBR5_9MICO|nr:carbohydrate ABC transporter permease [Salana multivorans]OJX97672.1 MAG: ABC transporter permease [Micrococcales bacterium 73-15]ROR97241.1 carbohydrate ABC transporter membrane protein 2 (CUT1 family) [Salana multivorans]
MTATPVHTLPTAPGGSSRDAARRFRRPPVGRLVAMLIGIAAAALAAFPLIVVLLTAFTPQSETLSWPPQLVPQNWTTANFPEVFERIPVWDQLWNTVAMSVGVTALSLFFDSLAAYALACIPFRGRGWLLGVLIATMMIPFQSLLIPLYKMLSELGWIGTLVGLIVPRAADVAGIFLLRQFFISIPRDLDSAARIDGASEFRIYWNIILPNATAGLLTLGLFNFIGNWNDMLWPMVMTNSASDRTLTAGLALLNGSAQGVVPYGVTMAGSLISVLPLIVIFAIVQKRFIEGVASTGIKG